MSNFISNYYQSFSGTDTIAFLVFHNTPPIMLGSLTTISYSMYRKKTPVVNLGRININGITRGIRIYAGTLVFSIINQHWVEELKKAIPWLSEYDEIKTDELPLFDIMIISGNEYGSYATMTLYGIDTTDEAQVISVEDMFTENTFSFVARDVSNLKAGGRYNGKGSVVGENHYIACHDGQVKERFFIMDSSAETDDSMKERLHGALDKLQDREQKRRSAPTLYRSLYYSTSNTLRGNDVNLLKQILNELDGTKHLELDGIFDSATDKAVRLYQSNHGLRSNGVVTQKLFDDMYNSLDLKQKQHLQSGTVINRNGSYVYDIPSSQKGNVLEALSFDASIPILGTTSVKDESGILKRYYITTNGYVPCEDVYSTYNEFNVVEFPDLKIDDCNSYVTRLQGILNDLYDQHLTTGVFDLLTESLVKRFQKEQGFLQNGIVSSDVWKALCSMVSTDSFTKDGIRIYPGALPGVYHLAKTTLESLHQYGMQIISQTPLQIKSSLIRHFEEGKEFLEKNFDLNIGSNLLSLNDLFPDAFTESLEHGIVKDVEFFIHPSGNVPYKWTIRKEKETHEQSDSKE